MLLHSICNILENMADITSIGEIGYLPIINDKKNRKIGNITRIINIKISFFLFCSL